MQQSERYPNVGPVRDEDISPYLRLPLRSYSEVMRERRRMALLAEASGRATKSPDALDSNRNDTVRQVP